MSSDSLKQRLLGAFGFPVTPFRRDLSLDLDALQKNVDAMVQHPFCAIVVAGGTGEIYSMTVDEIVETVRAAVSAVNGRMPVMAGVGFNTPIASELARRLEKAGADCLLVMPPYYVNAPEGGLLAYYEAVAKASGLPMAVYSRDWAVFTPGMVARLAEKAPTLQIWKDGQGDIRRYQRIIQTVGDRLAWVGGLGDDCASGYFAIGVQAYTSSISNIAPKVSLAIAEAGMNRDFEGLNALLAKYVAPLYAIRERSRGYEVTVMKEAMELLGMPAGPVRPPLPPCRPEDLDAIRELMKIYQDMI
jgi:5-dehydro-4-deoxyglucarate dehydratase